MMDAPRSVEPMIKVLRAMGQYRHDPAEVLKDFIDYGVGGLLVHGDPELAEKLKTRYGKEYGQLRELMVAWIGILDREVSDDISWFDALGTIYEYLASQSKRSWMGQFFTPPDLCDLMTQITIQVDGKGFRVNDPAAGSGRMLLSVHTRHPGNYMYGEDLDPICAKMCALNLAMHGAQGQVNCLDSLRLDGWRFGYELNPYHRLGGPPVPHLLPLREAQCVTLAQWRDRKEPAEKPRPVPVPAPRPEPAVLASPAEVVPATKPVQLSLF